MAGVARWFGLVTLRLSGVSVRRWSTLDVGVGAEVPTCQLGQFCKNKNIVYKYCLEFSIHVPRASRTHKFVGFSSKTRFFFYFMEVSSAQNPYLKRTKPVFNPYKTHI